MTDPQRFVGKAELDVTPDVGFGPCKLHEVMQLLSNVTHPCLSGITVKYHNGGIAVLLDCLITDGGVGGIDELRWFADGVRDDLEFKVLADLGLSYPVQLDALRRAADKYGLPMNYPMRHLHSDEFRALYIREALPSS